MYGPCALYGPISRHRKNSPIDELPDWYPRTRRLNQCAPMCVNVMEIVGTSRQGAIALTNYGRVAPTAITVLVTRALAA